MTYQSVEFLMDCFWKEAALAVVVVWVRYVECIFVYCSATV